MTSKYQSDWFGEQLDIYDLGRFVYIFFVRKSAVARGKTVGGRTSRKYQQQAMIYWVTQKLQQINTANHATFPIQIHTITVQICGNFWVTH